MQRMNDDMSEYEDQYTMNEYTNNKLVLQSSILNLYWRVFASFVNTNGKKSKVVASSLRIDDADQQWPIRRTKQCRPSEYICWLIQSFRRILESALQLSQRIRRNKWARARSLYVCFLLIHKPAVHPQQQQTPTAHKSQPSSPLLHVSIKPFGSQPFSWGLLTFECFDLWNGKWRELCATSSLWCEGIILYVVLYWCGHDLRHTFCLVQIYVGVFLDCEPWADSALECSILMLF